VNRSRTITLTLAFLILTAAFSAANDIYIAQNAAGGNTGADCADAHAAAWFNSGANWGSGTSQIGAGTTVHLCGTFTGTPGGSMLTAQGNGSNGKPITILFESGALMTAPYWSSSTGAINIGGRAYVVIDGGTPCGFIPGSGTEGTCNGVIQNTANGDQLAYQQNSLGIFAQGCSNCEIRNLGIYNIYVHVTNGAFNQQDMTHCIYFSGTGFLIHDNSLHDNGFCVYSNYTNDSFYQIYDNDIFNNDHGVVIAGADYVLQNVYIYGNHIHDFANWDCPNNGCHHDGIHAYNGSGGGVTNAYIYDNVFDGSMGVSMNAMIFMEGTSEGTPWTQNGTFYVFNNVIATQGSHSAVQLNIGTNNLLVNNTWLSTDQITGDQGFIYQNGGGTGSFSSQKNNAMYGLGQFESSNGTMTFTGSASSQCDYNVYVNSPGNGSGIWNWQTAGVDTSAITTWRLSGCDTHGSYTPTGTLNLNSNYVPQGGSVVIGAGTSLYSTCNGQPVPGLGALCSDAAGNPRSSSGNWDAGAFVYNSGGSAPGPPTGLTALVQ